MAVLMAALKPHADIILLDSPALLMFSDAISLAFHCDATLLVIRGGRIRAKTLAKINELLARFSLVPLGFVLNGTSRLGHKRYPLSAAPTLAAGRQVGDSLARLTMPSSQIDEGPRANRALVTGESNQESSGPA